MQRLLSSVHNRLQIIRRDITLVLSYDTSRAWRGSRGLAAARSTTRAGPEGSDRQRHVAATMNPAHDIADYWPINRVMNLIPS